MESIRSRLTKNFLMIIIVTILIIDVLMMVYLKRYYYESTRKLLESQIESSINFYNKYYSSRSLKDNVYDNIDAFWQNSEDRVQILNSSGKLIMDSFGIRDNLILATSDIGDAIKNGEGLWIGKMNYYNCNVMIVSKSINSNNTILGIMRIIYPLKVVDNTIRTVIFNLFALSLIVVIIGAILSYIKAREISDPIKKVTEVADKMAKGDLQIRSTISDNQEIEKLSNVLNYMASEIDNREKLKNQFISSVSHELRTPLTAIKGWVLTLQEDLDDKDTIKIGLEIVNDETERLTNMVEELLDFSKLINGIVQINKEECDIKKFIKTIENLMKPRAIKERKKFEVYTEIDNCIAEVDENKLKQVLINVLDNSLKFTDEGGKIKLKVSEEEKHIKFIIEDNGCGISKDELPKVKEKFYKGKNSKAQNGIGLSVCNEIISLHNGVFIIESIEEEGTKVTIKIPKNEKL